MIYKFLHIASGIVFKYFLHPNSRYLKIKRIINILEIEHQNNIQVKKRNTQNLNFFNGIYQRIYMDIKNEKLERIGSNSDGGYSTGLIQTSKNIKFISIGVGNDVSWESNLSSRGASGTQWDHTVEHSPENLSHRAVAFFRIGLNTRINSANSTNYHSLEQMYKLTKFSDDDYKLLKIDIEGNEWEPLSEAGITGCLQRFDQIIIEVHNLIEFKQKKQEKIIKTLDNLLVHHKVIHVHPNNTSFYLDVYGKTIHNVVELTLLNQRHLTQKNHLYKKIEYPSDTNKIDYHL